MPRSVLIATYVAWPVGVVVLRLLTRARLIVGSGVAVALWLATARGLTFTWAQDETYWVYDVGDRLVEVLSLLAGVVGVIGLT